MTEDEVNKVCKAYIERLGLKYKGVLNLKPTVDAKPNGYGQVPVPDGVDHIQVLIDHQGVGHTTPRLLWIEAKGTDDNFSELLQGFIRVTYACYHGGGEGLLAVPDHEYQELLEQEGFLKNVSRAAERRLGLFNAETQAVLWLDG